MINTNNILDRTDFDTLSANHSPFCVSIYLPTHMAGEPVRESKDILMLKNQIKQAYEQLEARGMASGNIPTYMQHIEALLDDRDFWEHQWNGLALFLSEDYFEAFRIPLEVEPFTYVGTHFYLRPMIPLLNDQTRFYLLKLALEEVVLYEGSHYQLNRIPVEAITPQKLEEVVGYDYKEASLQFHSGQGEGGAAIFHGHGSGKDDRKIEVTKFCRAVNEGLHTILHDASYPLVVAAVAYIFAIYEEVNTYNHLLSTPISGNPESVAEEELHQEAWEIVMTATRKELDEKQEQFQNLSQTLQTSADLRDILTGAMNGKVDTLFIEKNKEVWGTFDPQENLLDLDQHPNLHNDALLHRAAIETLDKGGVVYEVHTDEMPEAGATVMALFRY